jgi:hypothetical protein
MMEFDEQVYLKEMASLISAAKNTLKTKHPDIEVYSINIWTNPNAAISAVNVDTFQNSSTVVEQYNQWAKVQHDHWVAKGDLEVAKSFLPIQGRNYSVADFALTELEIIEHRAFDSNWESISQGRCWELLEPALLKAGELAKEIFANLRLHPEAELSVNSRRDWYDHTWSFR